MGVINLPTGKPTFALTGGAAERLAKLTPPGMTCFIHLTITDEYPYAQAQVIIEALPTPPSGAVVTRPNSSHTGKRRRNRARAEGPPALTAEQRDACEDALGYTLQGRKAARSRHDPSQRRAGQGRRVEQ